MPKNLEDAKNNTRKRALSPEVEKKRLLEIDEHYNKEINQVRFGNFAIGTSRGNLSQKQEAKEENITKQPQIPEGSKISAEDFYSAMNITAMQNKAQITVNRKEINPADYLSPERISDIEAAMNRFDLGVNKVADAIEQEFPGTFAPEAKMALAAQVFSRQE